MKKSSGIKMAGSIVGVLTCASVHAGGEQTLEKIVVTGSTLVETSQADAASVGSVSREQLAARSVYRPGELLEVAPGLIVSQHSGEGKANQFYLRGFNLDHGTDLRTSVDGMLVNQRSHSHGQGWTDLNFLIPELAAGLEYKKGPYFANEGDFSSAGSIHVKYQNSLPADIAEFGLGNFGYRRTLLAVSPTFGRGSLLYALEVLHNDGPYIHPDDYRKLNAVLRFSRGDDANGISLTAMAYNAKWNSTDQIAQRAVDIGLIKSRFDAIDATDGGVSHRYSLSASWQRTAAAGATRMNAYVVESKLDLFSNFTYFLDDPVNGDQFVQPDQRTTVATAVSHMWPTTIAEVGTNATIGIQFQYDDIHNALRSTRARQAIATTRDDHIREASVGMYLEIANRWSEQVRTVAGIRSDLYRFNVVSDNPLNSGTVTDSRLSPKLNFVLGPWRTVEYFLNLGEGFHSNDARGTTIRVDPKSGERVDRVSPLVRSRGGEVGVKADIVPGVQSALSVFRLDFASELVFAGDAGTTVASRPSRRIGVEFANQVKYGSWLAVDTSIAFSKARFRDSNPVGSRVPGAVEGVASVAISIDNTGPCFGVLQWRYFGPRPLIENNSVRSSSTAQFNGRLGYKLGNGFRLELEGYNLTNHKASAIDYYYYSRLKGESTEGVRDVHFHPLEPRSFRFTAKLAF